MKIVKWIDKYFEEALLIVLLMTMALIMGLQVCARYFFNSSMAWTEELTRYLFVWSGFLSIGFGIQKGIAIRIDMLTEMLSPKLKSWLYLLDYVVELVFFAYLLPFAYRYLIQTIASGQVSTAMRMPMSLLQAAPLVGFAISVVRLLQKIYKEFKAMREVKPCQ